MASSSSSSFDQPRYQVFLSFRGEDTRPRFTSHLLKALKDRGINVFFDEENLERGEEITPALLNSISASEVSIIVLSKDYASSKSCLIELSKIMECKLSQGQIVLPIFYQVDPSDVRHHAGTFEESFHQHLINKPKEVKRWKSDFTQVGNLKGWHIDGGIFDRSETEYIDGIVEVVIKKLSSKSTSVSEELVGIDEHVAKLLQLIDQEGTRVIGIWGVGGIGKTTLAEAIYNEVVSCSKFSTHHFLQNVREKSLGKNGMQSLQGELLSKLLKEDINIDTPSIGSTLIRDRLCNISAFVVLDDVSTLDQIKRLGVKHFGHGSKIIVTSRDQQVLKNIGIDQLHEVKKLNANDSLQLFSKFAFGQYNPVVDLQDLSMKFLQYAGGNPLALKVLGAALFQKTRDEWESALEKLEEYPEEDIFGPLKISFDGLGYLERNMFLDIACLFNGEGNNKNDEIKLLQGCYKGAQFGISNLVDKCLVDLRSGCPWMHDLLQEIGRDVVRQESEDPGKRSRLWSPEDVCRVLENDKGTESIKGISLNMSEIKALQICPAIFEKMVNLVFIRFYANSSKDMPGNKLLLANQDLKYLPDVLRYFGWDYCPLKSLPSNFDPRNLVELFLPNSNIEQLWDGEHEVVNLRVMDLSCCNNIRQIPNLSGATKLETLCCFECTSLVDLPSMTHLKSLKMLDLGDCPIRKFPEIPTNLEELRLGRTQIEELPSFIGSLKKLYRLNMSYTKVQNIPSSILKLDALIHFSLYGCPNITELNLNMTPMEEELPSSSMPRLGRLAKLDVSNCKSLKSISGLPPWLANITAKDCTSLERVSFTADDYQHQVIHPFKGFGFNNCFNLNQDACDNIITACLMIRIQFRVKQLAKQLTKNGLDVYDEKASHQVLCCLPGSEISDKFENQSRNSSISVKLASSATSRRFLCFALCLVLDFKHFREYEEHWYSIHSEYQLKGRDGVCQSFKRMWHRNSIKPNPLGCSSEHMFVLYRDDMVHRDMSYNEASFDFCVVGKCYHNHEELKVKVEKCGVHVFYVDAESSSISDVGSSINLSSDEDDKSCNPDIISPNIPVCPDWISSGGPMIEEDANVENGHGENPATMISKLDTKRS